MKEVVTKLSVLSGFPQVPYPKKAIVKSIESEEYDLVFVRFSEKDQTSPKFDYPYNLNRKLGVITPVKMIHENYKEGLRLFKAIYGIPSNNTVTVKFETCVDCDSPSKLTAKFEKGQKNKK
jgi:hypothetical protein